MTVDGIARLTTNYYTVECRAVCMEAVQTPATFGSVSRDCLMASSG
jgi:hypothetical protein